MALQAICPHCEGKANRMPIISGISSLDFFLCTACGQVSEAAKGGADAYSAKAPSIAPPRALSLYQH